MPLTLSMKIVPQQKLAPEQRLRPTIRKAFGETSGDIPLYSLHRIKGQLRRQPPLIDPKLSILLIRQLIAANADYKAESGNNWSCLTSSNLVDAIAMTDKAIADAINGINDMPREMAHIRDLILEKLHTARTEHVRIMQQWFADNFDVLHYDMSGKIPWAVVCRLRRDLGHWIATKSNPFSRDIEEMVLEVATGEGISTDDPEKAWRSMGGTVFRKKKGEE